MTSIGLHDDVGDSLDDPQQRAYRTVSFVHQSGRGDELGKLLFPCSHHYMRLA